jgi:hypothetical protein
MTRIPPPLRQAVLAAAQSRCAYCLSPEQMGVAFEIDHVISQKPGSDWYFGAGQRLSLLSLYYGPAVLMKVITSSRRVSVDGCILR